jgi:hypothetical protein
MPELSHGSLGAVSPLGKAADDQIRATREEARRRPGCSALAQAVFTRDLYDRAG